MPLRPFFVALVWVVTLSSVMATAAAETPLADADVAALADRAEAWADARQTVRDDTHELALSLAADARQAETDRAATQEALQLAEVAREAEATTTTAAPVTVAPTTVPPTTVPPTTTAPPTTAPSDATASETTGLPDAGSPSAAQWAALRSCESSGNYGAVSSNGRYRGAYQFSQDTWDWIASGVRADLVGVDPAAASPSDQDAVAFGLWERRGWAPWPHCGAAAAAS